MRRELHHSLIRASPLAAEGTTIQALSNTDFERIFSEHCAKISDASGQASFKLSFVEYQIRHRFDIGLHPALTVDMIAGSNQSARPCHHDSVADRVRLPCGWQRTNILGAQRGSDGLFQQRASDGLMGVL